MLIANPVILHAPSFEQQVSHLQTSHIAIVNTYNVQYQQFWLDPHEAPVAWVAILYGVMALGALLCMASQEDIPDTVGSPQEMMERFHRHATGCLLLSKYSTGPGPHTLEALLVNGQVEFIRRRDADLGVWLLGGVIVRIAMRMGYHRDSDGYPQISVFEGEMRRRIWGLVNQLDALTSYQIGLPPMIQDLHCDAKLPRNLLDEDFGPESTQLPLSRPYTELTPILYTINKTSLASIFKEIYTRVSLCRTDSYTEIMVLHQRLYSAREAISPRLRMTSIQEAVTVAPYILIRRYSLELLFQKTLCMLHRHHMTKSLQDRRFNFSRSCCVEAAMTILDHQASVFKELQPGGAFHRGRWFVTYVRARSCLMRSSH